MGTNTIYSTIHFINTLILHLEVSKENNDSY